jgi:hypothetical protein
MNYSYFFQNLASLFKRKEKALVVLDKTLIGKVVEVKFYDPTKIGIVSGNQQLSCTRFNHDEFTNRVVVGIVTNVGKWNGGPNFGKYVELEAFKPGIGKRIFLLLQQEIETMKVLG